MPLTITEYDINHLIVKQSQSESITTSSFFLKSRVDTKKQEALN